MVDQVADNNNNFENDLYYDKDNSSAEEYNMGYFMNSYKRYK